MERLETTYSESWEMKSVVPELPCNMLTRKNLSTRCDDQHQETIRLHLAHRMMPLWTLREAERLLPTNLNMHKQEHTGRVPFESLMVRLLLIRVACFD